MDARGATVGISRPENIDFSLKNSFEAGRPAGPVDWRFLCAINLVGSDKLPTFFAPRTYRPQTRLRSEKRLQRGADGRMDIMAMPVLDKSGAVRALKYLFLLKSRIEKGRRSGAVGRAVITRSPVRDRLETLQENANVSNPENMDSERPYVLK